MAVAVYAFVVQLDDKNVVETGENIFQPVWQGIDVTDVQSGDAVAGCAGAFNGFANRSLIGPPADEQDVSFRRAVNRRPRKGGGEGLQFLASFGRHFHVEVGLPSRMAHFVVFQAGYDRILSAGDARAGRRVPAHPIRSG